MRFLPAAGAVAGATSEVELSRGVDSLLPLLDAVADGRREESPSGAPLALAGATVLAVVVVIVGMGVGVAAVVVVVVVVVDVVGGEVYS